MISDEIGHSDDTTTINIISNQNKDSIHENRDYYCNNMNRNNDNN